MDKELTPDEIYEIKREIFHIMSRYYNIDKVDFDYDIIIKGIFELSILGYFLDRKLGILTIG